MRAEVRGFKQLNAFLRDLHDNVVPLAHKHAGILATHVRKEVVKRYMRYSAPPRGIGLEVLTRGKEFGPLSRRPARRPLAAESVMARLGHAVKIERRGTGRARTYRIHIDPKAKHPHGSLAHPRGVPLTLIAYQMEARNPTAVPKTHLMRTYLRMMREKRGGYGTRRSTKIAKRNRIRRNYLTGGMVILQPPLRPVWSAVQRRMHGLAARHFIRGYANDVGRIARRYGGKSSGSAG